MIPSSFNTDKFIQNEILQIREKTNKIGLEANITKQNADKERGNIPSFREIFSDEITKSEKLTFSKHASERLNSREINLSEAQLNRVESGVISAQNKGITDSLILVDDVALVVNVRKKHVITALNKGNDNISINKNEHIFTNINGAVIV